MKSHQQICRTGIFVLLCTLAGICAKAQDTARRKTINITSTFKPTLKDAAKINFEASAPVTDSSRPVLQYNLPSQYLFLTYQPPD